MDDLILPGHPKPLNTKRFCGAIPDLETPWKNALSVVPIPQPGHQALTSESDFMNWS
jgi:hypothetical protein